jgi:hypothetical protein
MATPAQIIANRLNAQKSTGPSSPEGKAASRFNALKHSASAKSLVIPGEDQAELAELAASYHEQFQPLGPEEALLLEKIIAADWTQRRMSRLEAEAFNTLIAQQDADVENPLGAAFLQDCQGPKALQQIFRRREAASREWYRALAELRARQALRIELLPPPSVELRTPAPSPLSRHPPQTSNPAPALPPRGKIGFVFDEATPPAWRL